MKLSQSFDLLPARAWRTILGVTVCVVLTPLRGSLDAATPAGSDLAQQIADVLLQAPEHKPGYRLLHAKGVVCEGSFTASKDAAGVSRAGHLAGAPVAIKVRLSDSAPDPAIPDGAADASPRGFAIRFSLPGGGVTDIVANSHNGFVIGTGEEFLELIVAKAKTDPAKPHPWPIEEFLASHPRALKFVQDPKPIPQSFATERFYGNNAFRFVNKDGVTQAGRYQILPVAGASYLSDAEAKAKPANFLVDEIKARLGRGPVKFRLVLQLAGAGDQTNDGSIVWPDDRKTVELGVITITSAAADNAAAERVLAFDPTRLTDGIALSDDPLPAIRSRVYAISVANRLK